MNSENISEMIEASLGGIKDFARADSAIGGPILTPNGSTIIPISKVSIGFAGGGLDISGKRLSPDKNGGSIAGTGASVTPIAFFVIDSESKVQLIPITDKPSAVEKALDLVQEAPEILKKIRRDLS